MGIGIRIICERIPGGGFDQDHVGRNLIGSRVRLQYLPVPIQGMFHIMSLMFVFVVCLEI